MNAKLRYNPEHDAYEVTVGESVWAEEFPEDGDCAVVLEDTSEPMLLILEGGEYEGLKPNTVYTLVEVSTELEDDGDAIEDDEGNVLGGGEEEPAGDVN